MLDATPGIMAPAATATKPAIKAYSMRSWAWVFFHTASLYKTVMVHRIVALVRAHSGRYPKGLVQAL